MIFLRRCLSGFRWLLLLASVLLQLSCSPSVSVLRIGASPWPSYELFQLAQKLGYFDTEQIELTELTTSSHVMHALKSGSLDGALLTMHEVLILLSQGVELKVVAALDHSVGGDAVVAQVPITSLDELIGKRIGFESNGLGGVLVNAFLQKADLKPHQLLLVESKFDEQLSEFREGWLDLVVTSSPLKTHLVNHLNGHVLFDSSELQLPVYRLLVIRAEVADKMDGQLMALLKGYYRAQGFLKSYPVDAYKLMAARLQLFYEDLGDSFKETQLLDQGQSLALMKGSLSPLERQSVKVAQQLQLLGSINKLPELSRCFSDSWIKKIVESGVE